KRLARQRLIHPGHADPISPFFTRTQLHRPGVLGFTTKRRGYFSADPYTTNNTVVLQDSTGSIIDYETPTSIYTPNVGDVIDLTISNTPYQDGPELKGSTTTGLTVVSSGNAVPSYPVITLPTFNAASGTGGSASPYGESIVTIDNVQFASGTPNTLVTSTNYTITDGTNTAILYAYKSDSYVGGSSPNNGLDQLNALGGGSAGLLDITGYVSNYYGTSEFYPLSAVAVATPEPSSIVLLGLGALALAGVARRRMRTQAA
ncbi:MAG TPA: PEP-CTERM sorting domain-containing protein, partial [Pirellulales bacterium]|nr:PEP-CTERM sorting domain-containing protein [Pirellulales bacterium]